MLELADAGLPRAFLRVGGATIARHQLRLALALRCERIICIARGMSPELIELQHDAEARGAQFHVIPGARSLLGLITATDELFVLGDGLFASPDTAAALLDQGQAVLVQPIEQGLAAGFERIDINHASAAAMYIPGRLVESIAELPSDCDAASALQRIALQGGVRQRAIPGMENGALFWNLVRSDSEAHALEPRWIRQRIRDDSALYPSRALALFTVQRLGSSILHAGSGAAHLIIGAAMLAAIAIGAGWLGFYATGLVFCAFGWFLCEAAGLLARVEAGTSSGQRLFNQVSSYGLAIDAIIIGLAGFGAEAHPWQSLPDRLFPAFMLVALLRILPRVVSLRWSAWFQDRAVLAVILAGALAGGAGNFVLHAGAVIAALAGIGLPGLTKRLTRP
ncbi:MAG: hypothetical protein KGM18_02770 [Sphingomonadales bacterium]|nr:hypothetical protein [Sphingomonadales bacterium]